jgi:glycyl-tRNA synthetase alpha subunit
MQVKIFQVQTPFIGLLRLGVMVIRMQDVVFEQLDDVVPGEGRRFAAATVSRRKKQEKELRKLDVSTHVMVYLKCLQRVLQEQAHIINGWFGCQAYDGVLKQMWKIMILDSRLLDASVTARSAFSSPRVSLFLLFLPIRMP